MAHKKHYRRDIRFSTAGFVRVARKLAERLTAQPELRAAIALTVFVFALSEGMSGRADQYSFRQHLGAEYYCIARAPVDGRGFSDPFCEPSGATAWVPPLYPFLIATLLKLLGSKAAAARAIVLLTNATLIFAGTTIYAICRREQHSLPAWLSLPLYALWIGSNFFYTFVLTGDIWLQLLVFTGMTIALYQRVKGKRLRAGIWGGLGGLATLVSPSLAFGWCALFILPFFRKPAERLRWLSAGVMNPSETRRRSSFPVF